jgi:AbrB family looped-hinge helix DNA binding protein
MKTRRRARIRDKGQVTLPPEIRAALHVGEGDEVEFTVTEGGDVLLRGFTSVPADQRWFWTPEWQAGEREASEDIAAGRTTYHAGEHELFAAWEAADETAADE